MKKNPTIHSRTLEPKDNKSLRYPDQDSPAHLRALAKQEIRQQFISVPDQVAQSVIWFKNWKVPGMAEKMPHHPELRFVDKYYPYAKGGPLLVDEPIDPSTADVCYAKQKFLKSLGFRHIVIQNDTRLDEVLAQLGEL